MEENVDLSTICDLEEKLITARNSLTTLNDNIRRFVGRGLKDFRFLIIISRNGMLLIDFFIERRNIILTAEVNELNKIWTEIFSDMMA